MTDRKPNIIAVIGSIFAVILIFVFLMWFFGAKCAGAQDNPTVSLDLTRGLKTSVNPLKRKGFSKLHNYLLDDEIGSLVLRKGDKALTDSLDSDTTGAYTRYGRIVDTATGSGVLYFYVDFTDGLSSEPGGFWDGDTLQDSAGNKLQVIIRSQGPELGDPSKTLLVCDTPFAVGFGPTDSIMLLKPDSITYKSAFDTGGVTGIYAYYKKPRSKYLLGVLPGFGARNQWSSLYMSQANEYDMKTLLAPYIYKGETPIWETWGGFVHIALPRQRPLITNGDRTVHLVPRAPGQLEIVPSPDSVAEPSWRINGSVRYALYQLREDSTLGATGRPGYVSHLVTDYGEVNILTNFPRPVSDSLMDVDSVKYILARTRGYDLQPRPPIDSFFVIDSIIEAGFAFLDTFIFIDSIPNESLGVGNWGFVGADKGVIPLDTAYVNAQTDIKNIDPATITRPIDFGTVGAPTFIAQFMTAPANDWWPDAASLKDSSNKDHVGWRYMVTIADTLTGIMSDSSPNLWVSTPKPSSWGGGDSTVGIHIGVPPLGAGDTGKVRIVWRAQVKWEVDYDKYRVVGEDTIAITFKNKDSTDLFDWRAEHGYPGYYMIGRRIDVTTGEGYEIWQMGGYIQYTDTILTTSQFRPVGVLTDPTDTLFADSVSFTEWIKRGRDKWDLKVDPVWHPLDNRIDVAQGFFAFKDNLFAWSDNRIFRSVLDTPIFRPFNDISFDPENGDIITQITNVGENIIVFWSDGLTELYDPNASLPTKGSPVEGMGCYAPHSLINYGGIAYFLAKDGIRAISSHPVKTHGVSNNIISRPINDILIENRSDSLKSTMVGAVGPRGRYLVWCYPSIDTMFLYFPPHDGLPGRWATRDGSFFQATHYDTNSIGNLIKSTALVYTKTGDERIFGMEASETYYDSGLAASVVGEFETAPLFTDYNYWTIDRVGITRGFKSGQTNKNITIRLYDEYRNNLVAYSLFNDSAITYRALPSHSGRRLVFNYLTSSIQPTIADTIRSVDIWARPVSPTRLR